MQMNCCTSNLHPLLKRKDGRVESFGKTTSEGPRRISHFWEKCRSKQFAWASEAKPCELWTSSPACPGEVGFFTGAAWISTGKFSHPERKGSHGVKPEAVRGGIGERGFICSFFSQQMSPFCWVGLIRNRVHMALSICWSQASQCTQCWQSGCLHVHRESGQDAEKVCRCVRAGAGHQHLGSQNPLKQ